MPQAVQDTLAAGVPMDLAAIPTAVTPALARRYPKGKEDMAIAAVKFGHETLIEGLRSRLKRPG